MPGRVGMVGLGLMGQAFSANLLKAGFEVQGFDIDSKRMDELKGRGGAPVGSPAGGPPRGCGRRVLFVQMSGLPMAKGGSLSFCVGTESYTTIRLEFPVDA